MDVRIYKILKHTSVEGPKVRYCIWFQGCSRHCNGCWAKATWSHSGGTVYNACEILEDILNTKGIDGVTFLGGEPFEQPDVLEFLSKNIKKSGLSVVCFTGGRLENLRKQYPRIIENIDLLIDGEFIEKEKDFSRPWVGSKNQRFHFLTDRFNKSILTEYKNKIEVNISKNGGIFINGMGDFDKFVKNIKLPLSH